MKKMVLTLFIVLLTAIASNALLLTTADVQGSGGLALQLGIGRPGENSLLTEYVGILTYGFDASTDVYCRLGMQSFSGGSRSLLGVGAKRKISEAVGSVPLNSSWVLDLNYLYVANATVTGLIGGFIVSRSFGPFTPYGIIGLSYHYTNATSGSNSSNTGTAVGGGFSYALRPGMNIKGEALGSFAQGEHSTAIAGSFELSLK